MELRYCDILERYYTLEYFRVIKFFFSHSNLVTRISKLFLGSSWQMLQTVDSWSSSYSAMVIMQQVNQRTDDDHRDVTSMTSLATMQPANQRTDEDHSHVTSMTSSEATVTEDRVGILYERSRELTPIFVPDQITFQTFTFNT